MKAYFSFWIHKQMLDTTLNTRNFIFNSSFNPNSVIIFIQRAEIHSTNDLDVNWAIKYQLIKFSFNFSVIFFINIKIQHIY